MRKVLMLILFFLSFLSLLVHLHAGFGEELEKGKIINKIICQSKPAQSYALYLPQEYTPQKKWPILYAIDPSARGKAPLEHFQAAAKRYGYIIACSNNARNGPWEPIFRALYAVWIDTNARLSIDKKRIYVAGFSGGSKAASLFSKIIKRPVAGIIGTGAGLATGLKPQEILPAFYYGIAGLKDFNYKEMMHLDEQFDEQNVSHRFLVYDGAHAWPPPYVCMRAIEWMEIIAMSRRIRPRNDNMIQEIYKKELTEAEAFETSGDLLGACAGYGAIASAFKEWRDTADIQTKVQQIKQSKNYKRQVKKENKRIKKEVFLIRNLSRIFLQIENKDPLPQNLNRIFFDMGINDLLRQKKGKKNRYDSALAFRVLLGLEINASDKGWAHSEKGDHKRAIFFFEIAAKASDKDSYRQKYIFYNLACVYAVNKNKKKALQNLKLAVQSGFSDIATIEKDEDLDSIRQTSEFHKIIQTLKK